MSKTVKTLIIILIIIFIGVFLFSGYKIYSTLHEYHVAEKQYDDLSSAYVKANSNTSASPTPTDEDEEIVFDDEISPVEVDFDALLEQCSDVAGWLYCPDTRINYPVTQTDDNMLYLHHLITGEYNASGTLFIECMCPPNFGADNTIIYGHHMNDGSMFASLESYKYQNYYDEHPVMYINTPTYNYRLDLFAGFTTESDSDVYAISFGSDEEYQQWLDEVISQSTFTTDVKVTPKDKIVTLSTCSYDYDDARYVVLGKLTYIH